MYIYVYINHLLISVNAPLQEFDWEFSIFRCFLDLLPDRVINLKNYAQGESLFTPAYYFHTFVGLVPLDIYFTLYPLTISQSVKLFMKSFKF